MKEVKSQSRVSKHFFLPSPLSFFPLSLLLSGSKKCDNGGKKLRQVTTKKEERGPPESRHFYSPSQNPSLISIYLSFLFLELLSEREWTDGRTVEAGL